MGLRNGFFLALALGLALTGLAAAQAANPFLVPAAYAPERGASGGTLTHATFTSGNSVTTWNPIAVRDTLTSRLIGRFLPGTPLVTRFIDNEWRPYLAESYEVAPDFRSITYRLREGVRWSDGTPLAVEDFQLWWEITATPEIQSNSYTTTLVGETPTRLVKVDDLTMRFEFGEVPFDVILKSASGVVPAHIFGPVWRDSGVQGVLNLWNLNTPPSQLVALNAFRMRSFSPDERIEWEPNPHFDWVRLEVAPQDRLPYLDRIVELLVPTQDQQLALFLGGTSDLLDDGRQGSGSPRGADDLRTLVEARNRGMAIEVHPNVSARNTKTYLFLNFNHVDPWKASLFRNSNFRKAMQYLIDADGMIEAAFGGLGSLRYSLVTPVAPQMMREFFSYDFDPERAAEMLRQLGFTRKDREGFLIDGTGRRLEFDLTTNAGNSQREAMGRVFAAEAAKVGVKVNFQPIAFNILVNQLVATAQDDNGRPQDRGFDGIIIGIGGGAPEFSFGANIYRLGALLHAWNTALPQFGPFQAFEVELDRLQKLYDTEPDPERRQALLDQAQRVDQEHLPYLRLPVANAHFARSARVGGVFPAELMNDYYGYYAGDFALFVRR